MKIIIVDDNDTFKDGIKYFIEQIPNYTVIAEASNATEFLSLSNITNADIILMDIVMPETSGIEASQKILWQYNYLKIIAVTMFTNKAYLEELIDAGFKGCIYKAEIYNKLEKAIETVQNGKLYFSEEIMVSEN